ncbi:MAG TPA: hypothetical protein VLV54_10235 [Thermoanaerobaculia bacterium]|nr:hypothetical protein [Thermoanaerobaculia bacterium]
MPFDPVAFRELAAKLRAFALFRGAGMAPERALARTARLSPWPRLFVLEGIGYAWGNAGWPPQSSEEGALIPLTMGWGLALAVRSFRSARARITPEESLRSFAAACRELAPPGLAGVAFEGLGLVARLQWARAVPSLARALGETDADLEARFWHGVGRGLFFLPGDTFLWGSSAGRALTRALHEPPAGLPRSNALAGLAMAITLICLPHPGVIDRFLSRHSGRIDDVDSFRCGIAAAALVWCRSAGQDEILQRLLAYPSQTPEHWQAWVRRPCERALGEHFPALVRDGGWDDLFRVMR